jgi:hypothetical protein
MHSPIKRGNFQPSVLCSSFKKASRFQAGFWLTSTISLFEASPGIFSIIYGNDRNQLQRKG